MILIYFIKAQKHIKEHDLRKVTCTASVSNMYFCYKNPEYFTVCDYCPGSVSLECLMITYKLLVYKVTLYFQMRSWDLVYTCLETTKEHLYSIGHDVIWVMLKYFEVGRALLQDRNLSGSVVSFGNIWRNINIETCIQRCCSAYESQAFHTREDENKDFRLFLHVLERD